jgi:O-antigen/teichoic acid export membrane protein
MRMPTQRWASTLRSPSPSARWRTWISDHRREAAAGAMVTQHAFGDYAPPCPGLHAVSTRRTGTRPLSQMTSPRPSARSSDDLRSLIAQGLVWKGVSQVVLQLSKLAVVLILARLLTPHEYGIAAMALVFATLVFFLSDLSLGNTLIQRKIVTEADRSTVFWTSIGIGSFFTLLGIVLSGPLAAFYGEPAVGPLLAALSASFIITAVGTTQNAILVREMEFRSLELRDISATLAGAAVGISTAFLGYGAWAIIAQQLTYSSAATLLVWRYSSWRPRRIYSLASLRGLAGFTGNVFAANIIDRVRLNTDTLLIGRFLGASAVGVYALACNVILVPFNRVAVPMAQVLLPAFARIQDERDRVASMWLHATRLLGAVSIPALLGLVVVAPDVVEVALGNRWSGTTPVIQLLAWIGLLQTLQILNSPILQALDRTSTILVWSIVNVAAGLLAFFIGFRWDIVGVAAAFLVVTVLVTPLFIWRTARVLGIPLRRYAQCLSGVVQASLAMVACVTAARLAMVEYGVSGATRLALLVILGAAVYLPLCAWREPAVVAEFRRLVRRQARPVPPAEMPPLSSSPARRPT